MQGPFSLWLDEVKRLLKEECRVTIGTSAYTNCLDWYESGMAPDEAAHRLNRATSEGPQ